MSTPRAITRIHPALRFSLDGERDPDWVDAILDWQWTWPIARVLLVSLFIMAAGVEIVDFQQASAVQDGLGLHPGWAWNLAAVAIQLSGSFIIISGKRIWLGAGMLAAFTGATEIIAHRFWQMSGQAEFQARNEFFEHLGLVAGFVMVALLAEERSRRAHGWSYNASPTGSRRGQTRDQGGRHLTAKDKET